MPLQMGDLPLANRWFRTAKLLVPPASLRKDELLRSSHLSPVSVVTSNHALQLRFPHISNVPIVSSESDNLA
ncbi:MAG: hypothetical protein K0Q83_3221 [Deltaproteobacteria bacterium]|jgi:hypothetical protein|nr:hypothetical protein [Deltaproteobacteria bacterium]